MVKVYHRYCTHCLHSQLSLLLFFPVVTMDNLYFQGLLGTPGAHGSLPAVSPMQPSYAMDYFNTSSPSSTPAPQASPKVLTTTTQLIEAILQFSKTRNSEVTNTLRSTVLSLMQNRKLVPPKETVDNRDVIAGRYIVDNIRQVASLCPETSLLESILVLNFDIGNFTTPIQRNLTTAKAELQVISVGIPDAPPPVEYSACLSAANLKFREASRNTSETVIKLKEDLQESQLIFQRAQRKVALQTTSTTPNTTTLLPTTTTETPSLGAPRDRSGVPTHNMTTRLKSSIIPPSSAAEQLTSTGTSQFGGAVDADDADEQASPFTTHVDPSPISDFVSLEAEVLRLAAAVAAAEKAQRGVQYAIDTEADSIYKDLMLRRDAVMHDRQTKLARKTALLASITEMDSVLAVMQTYILLIKSVTELIKVQVLSNCPTLLSSLDQSIVIPLTGDEVHQPYTNGHLPGMYALLVDKFYRSSAMDFFKDLRATVQLRMTSNNLQDGIALVDNVIATWFKLDYWQKLTPDAFSCMLLLNVLPESLEPIRTAGIEHLLEQMADAERHVKHSSGIFVDTMAPITPDAAPKLLQYSSLKEKLKLLVTSRTNPHAPNTASVSGVADAAPKPQYQYYNKGNTKRGQPQQAYAATSDDISQHNVLTKGVQSLACQAHRKFGYVHVLDGGARQPYVSMLEPCRQCANPAVGKTHDPLCSPLKCSKCELYGHTKAFCAQLPSHTRAEIVKRKAEGSAPTTTKTT